MEKWEYKSEWLQNRYGKQAQKDDLAESVMKSLNDLGEKGWEAFNMVEYYPPDCKEPGGWWLVLLKRRKAAETESAKQVGDAEYAVRSAG